MRPDDENNNAAESSHATLNASVRVSGAVSMDMFLFAVEKQMMKTKREIEAGCPSHTKAIYARRNRLLAVELSDLIAGRQGVLRFLDHCAMVMNIKNLSMLEKFTNKKQTELRPPEEPAWIEQNRQAVVRAAVRLYAFLHPSSPRPVEDIIQTVEAWSFQPETCEVDLGVVAEDSVLSMARRSPRPSFLAIRNRLLGDLESTEFPTESEQRDQPLPPRQPTVVRYEGASYRLVIMK